jgi:hypothetical protein
MTDAVSAPASNCQRDAVLRFRNFITFLPVAPLFLNARSSAAKGSICAVHPPTGTGSTRDDEGFAQNGQASMQPDNT